MSSKHKKSEYRRSKDLNVIFHKKTNLVVSSVKHPIVTGRIVNNKVDMLDGEAVGLCEQYEFEFDKTKVVEDEEEKETVSDNEEEQGEENMDEEKEIEDEVEKEEEKEIEDEEESEHPVNNPEEPESTYEDGEHNDDEEFSVENTFLSDFDKLVNIHNNQVKDLLYENVQKMERENELLKKQLKNTKEELCGMKKKMKNLLMAMQDSL